MNLWIVFRVFLLGAVLSIVSIIDYRYYRISRWSCLAVGCIGLIDRFVLNRSGIECILGFLSVSFGLMLIYLLSKGRCIGGGDIKLMAVSGILLGWRKNIIAFFVGCLSVICFYPIRKIMMPKRKKIALAPYLSFGMMVVLLWGDALISAYVAWPGIS